MRRNRQYGRMVVMLLVVMLGLSMLIAVPRAQAGCASEDRIALAQMGHTRAQIDAMCGSGGNPFVTPSMPSATVCATPAGGCYLGEQIPVGSQCWCPRGMGQVVHGVAR
jgi:hypothetical protein